MKLSWSSGLAFQGRGFKHRFVPIGFSKFMYEIKFEFYVEEDCTNLRSNSVENVNSPFRLGPPGNYGPSLLTQKRGLCPAAGHVEAGMMMMICLF